MPTARAEGHTRTKSVSSAPHLDYHYHVADEKQYGHDEEYRKERIAQEEVQQCRSRGRDEQIEKETAHGIGSKVARVEIERERSVPLHVEHDGPDKEHPGEHGRYERSGHGVQAQRARVSRRNDETAEYHGRYDASEAQEPTYDETSEQESNEFEYEYDHYDAAHDGKRNKKRVHCLLPSFSNTKPTVFNVGTLISTLSIIPP